jgi:hypothetical protein
MRKHYVGIAHYSGLYFPIPDWDNVEFIYYYVSWALFVGIDETPP